MEKAFKIKELNAFKKAIISMKQDFKISLKKRVSILYKDIIF